MSTRPTVGRGGNRHRVLSGRNAAARSTDRREVAKGAFDLLLASDLELHEALRLNLLQLAVCGAIGVLHTAGVVPSLLNIDIELADREVAERRARFTGFGEVGGQKPVGALVRSEERRVGKECRL